MFLYTCSFLRCCVQEHVQVLKISLACYRCLNTSKITNNRVIKQTSQCLCVQTTDCQTRLVPAQMTNVPVLMQICNPGTCFQGNIATLDKVPYYIALHPNNHFYQRGRIASYACAGIATPERCPSVCPFVTLQYCIKTKIAPHHHYFFTNGKPQGFCNVRFTTKFESGHLERQDQECY